MKVSITVIRETKYCSIVEMTQDQFDKYNQMMDRGTRQENEQAEKELNEMIDMHDWQDDELRCVDRFEIV